MNEKRQRMLEEQLRSEISTLILGGEIKDPRIGPLVSVTRVEVAKDASTARVFVSTFGLPAESEGATVDAAGVSSPETSTAKAIKRLDEAVAGLQSAAGFVQSHLAKRIHTRLTPRLHFIADRGIREGFEMTERIRSLFP